MAPVLGIFLDTVLLVAHGGLELDFQAHTALKLTILLSWKSSNAYKCDRPFCVIFQGRGQPPPKTIETVGYFVEVQLFIAQPWRGTGIHWGEHSSPCP